MTIPRWSSAAWSSRCRARWWSAPRHAADPALAFLWSDELARTLRFRSGRADQENVRELIRRVRRKLQSVGIDGLIDSRRHAGYRLGWAVSPR